MCSDRPILIPLLFLVIGCLLIHQMAAPFSIAIPFALAIALGLSLLLRKKIVFCLLLALFWVSWGMAALAPRLDNSIARAELKMFDGKQVMLEGLLASRPVVLPEGQRLELKLELIGDGDKLFSTKSRRVLITIYNGHGDWVTGDRVRCNARLRLPRLLGLPGEFDFPLYLAMHGIDALARVKNAESVVLMRGGAASSLQRWVDIMAMKSQSFIRESFTQPDQSGLLLALATGSQREIPPELAAAYSRAGASHILSVSGFHVGVITAVWIYLLRWLLLRWEWLALRIDIRRVSLLSAFPVMLLYLLFTGGEPATARSVLMLYAVIIAVWSEREVDILDTLLLAAFLLLLYDPVVLFELSFQLSFLALWGIVVLTPYIKAPFEKIIRHEWQHTFVLLCSASLAATLSTLMPVLSTFHQASLIGILANLLIVPLLGYGATVLATFAVPFIFALPPVAWLLLQPASWLVSLSNYFVLWIAGFPVLRSFDIKTADVLASVCLLALISFVSSVRLRVLSCCLLLTGILLVHFKPVSASDGTLQFYFLSVGQGDAALIRLPDGRTMLVDGGGYLRDNGKDFGERYLVPALRKLKVRQIDIMVLSHPHPDHLGGLPAVAEQFVVSEFWQMDNAAHSSQLERLVKALSHQRTRIRTLKSGDIPFTASALTVKVLSPPLTSVSGKGDNDESLVLMLQYGRFSALMTGDAGFKVEEDLIRKGIGKTTLLKVGHHGSKGSSSELFLQRIKPEVAVISAGAGNSFGLPAPETVERIRRQGAALYRTDIQGTIQLKSDGERFEVTPFKKRSE